MLAYQVIARKWRPKEFDELVGQNHVSQTLLNALRGHRLHHALLFTGPRGTGKTSSARILAKSLRCPNAVDYVPCHKCTECEDIALGRSLNVIEIDGASNNGVDAIRELIETVGYMPSTGKYKLYIIDEVHMLSTSAFNALLKTLEEPPEHVIFVMATTEAHKIPNTILSRCQRYDFRRIPIRLISERLKMICDADGIAADKDALWMIAKQAEGSMRDSQSLLDQVITFSGKILTSEKVIEVLGLTDRTLLLEAMSAMIARDAQLVLEVLKKILLAGYDPRIFVQDFLEEARHLLLVKLAENDPGALLDLPESELEALKALGTKASSEDIHLLFDMALKGAADLLRSQDPQVLLEMLFLRMSQAPRIESLEKLLAGSVSVSAPAPVHVHSRQSTSPADSSRSQPTANVVSPRSPSTPTATVTETRPDPGSGDIGERWSALVQKIKGVNPMVGAKLENSFLSELKGKSLIVGVSPKLKFLFEQMNTPDFRKKVVNYVATFWGPGFDVEIRVIDGGTNSVDASAPAPTITATLTPKALDQKKQNEETERTRQQIEDHPMVRTTKNLFKTEIKSIKESK